MTTPTTHPWDPATLLRDRIAPEEILRRCGRTFHAASRLLPRHVRHELAVLYAFCRLVDDCGDLASCKWDGDSSTFLSPADLLREVEANLSGDAATSPIISDFLTLASQRGIPLRLPTELLEGIRSDIGSVRFREEGDLIRYAYRVASTVGLMMCRVLGVPSVADPHAIDLGIAMQLTNIARDVREDALRDRVYLPASWIDAGSVIRATIDAQPVECKETIDSVERLLLLADTYYESADAGMRYLPRAVRPAIRAAAANYRAIGGVIRRDPERALHTRVRTTDSSKMVRSAHAIARAIADESPRSVLVAHDKRLHTALVIS